MSGVTVYLDDFDIEEILKKAREISEKRGVLDEPWYEEKASKEEKTIAYNVLSQAALNTRDKGDVCRANSLELVARGLLGWKY